MSVDRVAAWGYFTVIVRAVAIKELKNRLSAYIREMAQGEVVLVTDRGRVVAELRRSTREVLAHPVEQALARPESRGVLVRGLPQTPDAYRRSNVKMSADSQTLLNAGRGEK